MISSLYKVLLFEASNPKSPEFPTLPFSLVDPGALYKAPLPDVKTAPQGVAVPVMLGNSKRQKFKKNGA